MNTKILSTRAMSVIDQYMHFSFGTVASSVPYFNNKKIGARATLRTHIGKGSPRDIFEELQSIAVKNHIPIESFSDDLLKKMMLDNNIGIDCSGFAYYVLNAESEETKKGPLDKHISFTSCHGLIGKIRCSLRPVENCDVSTFAHNNNSRVIELKDVSPGDMICMLGDAEESERDHILVVHQVEYQNFIPTQIHYSHAVAYPEDGIYNTGIKQGTIEIALIEKPILYALWNENGKTGLDNTIFKRAQKSRTELRRLNWF